MTKLLVFSDGGDEQQGYTTKETEAKQMNQWEWPEIQREPIMNVRCLFKYTMPKSINK